MKTIGTQVVMPLNVAKMIDENDPVFKMAEILSELDYRKLRGTYRRRWRSISPEIMFSIVVYANMKGIYSSRGIEEACRTDIRFMWLLQYRKAPDHTTISRFLENNILYRLSYVSTSFFTLLWVHPILIVYSIMLLISSSGSILYSFAKAIKFVVLGSLAPLSHLETACLLTPNDSATNS